MNSLLRHIAACNTADLPGERAAFIVAGHYVGYVRPTLAPELSAGGVRRVANAFLLDDPLGLPDLGGRMASAGLCRFRDELFDVRDDQGAVLGQIDRGALPLLGLRAHGVHLNGLVTKADGLHMWLARRAATKLLDPGKLDHIVAGGVPAGLDPAQTLVKEAAEEAGMAAALVAQATSHGTIAYAMERPEGLRRDVLHCYDLMLPERFTPHPVDGEVAEFTLWPMAEIIHTLRRTDEFKFNVSLVLIHLLLRRHLVAEPEASRLRAALTAGG